MVVIVEKVHPRGRDEKSAIDATRRMDAHAQTNFAKDVDEWWQKVYATARRLCPVGTPQSTHIEGYVGGTLKDTIRIVFQAPAGGFYEVTRSPDSIQVDRMITAGGLLINPNTGRMVDYALAVHDGHPTKGGGFVAPRPFLDDSILMHEPELDAIMRRFTKEMGDIWER